MMLATYVREKKLLYHHITRTYFYEICTFLRASAAAPGQIAYRVFSCIIIFHLKNKKKLDTDIYILKRRKDKGWYERERI